MRHARALAVGGGGSWTALDTARGLKENGAGSSGGGGGKRGNFNHRSGGKHTGPSGLGDLEVRKYISHAYAAGRSRKRTAHLSTWQPPKQDSCQTNNPLHSFIVPFTYIYNCIYHT